MVTYIIRRMLISIPVIFLMVLATFLLVHAMPGGPFDAVGERPMPPAIREILIERWGLNEPLLIQFQTYTKNLVQGDLGPLFGSTSRNVNDVVADTFPVSVQLGIMSLILGFGIGIPAGIIAAIKHNSLFDYSATFLAVILASIPNLVLAPILIYIFGVRLDWLEFTGWGGRTPVYIRHFSATIG